jgi:hypothetical protein
MYQKKNPAEHERRLPLWTKRKEYGGSDTSLHLRNEKKENLYLIFGGNKVSFLAFR